MLIAFFLNSLLKILESNFKFKRWVNVLIVYVFFYGIIILFLTIITPKVVDSIKNLAKEIPRYAEETRKWLYNTPAFLDEIGRFGILGDNMIRRFFSKLVKV